MNGNKFYGLWMKEFFNDVALKLGKKDSTAYRMRILNVFIIGGENLWEFVLQWNYILLRSKNNRVSKQIFCIKCELLFLIKKKIKFNFTNSGMQKWIPKKWIIHEDETKIV